MTSWKGAEGQTDGHLYSLPRTIGAWMWDSEEKMTFECLGIGAGNCAGLPQTAEKSQCLVAAKNDLLLFKPLHFSHLKPLPVLYVHPWSSSSQLLKALHHSPTQLPAREQYITDPHWVLCPSFFLLSFRQNLAVSGSLGKAVSVGGGSAPSCTGGRFREKPPACNLNYW